MDSIDDYTDEDDIDEHVDEDDELDENDEIEISGADYDPNRMLENMQWLIDAQINSVPQDQQNSAGTSNNLSKDKLQVPND